MAGYARTNTADITASAVVKSQPINNELNEIVAAFAFSGGHDHSGSDASTSGAFIPLIADVDALNKVAIDTTNNRVGFFTEVSSAAAEQVRIQTNAIIPVSTGTGTVDLGSGSAKFKDGHFAGDVNVGDDLTISDDVLLQSDGAVLKFGTNDEVTLTHVHDTGLLLNSTMALQFNDASQFINAPTNEILDINATAEIELNATLVDVNANLDVSGTLAVAGGVTLSGTISGTTITATTAFVPNASDGGTLGTASLQFSDLFLADGAIIKLGDDQDTTLTHVADAGILLNSTRQLQFGDSGTYIHQSADGVLDLVSDTEIEINATTIDINGAADISGNLAVGGTLGATGNTTLGGTLAVTGATTLATTSFGDTNITAVGDIALDSISATATDINVAVSDNSATAFTVKQGSDAYLIIDTANSSESVSIGTGISGTAITLGHATSEVTVADNLTVSGNTTVTGNLTVNGTTTTVNSTTVTLDDPVITLGGDTAPSSDDNKDRGVEFRYHDGSSARVGFFGWDDSATAFTFLTAATNSSEVFSGTAGNLAGLGTIGSGAITSTGAIQGTSFVVANGGNIGSVSDTDAITIASGGGVTFSQGVTSTAASNTLGATGFNDANITAVGDIALDSISAAGTDIAVAVSDGSATALTIKQGSNAYLIIDTADSSESVSIGTGVSGTAVSIGHSVSTVTVNDNLTVTDTATFGSLSDGSVTIANFVNEAAGINSNDNDTTIPTSAAVKDLVSSSANVTGLNATGTELNAVADVSAVNSAGIDTSTAIADTDGILVFDKSANSNEGGIGYFDVDLLDTYYAGTTKTLTNKTLTAPVIVDNGFISDGTNELLRFQAVGSALNELEITNASTGNGPIIGAAGETNVDINITPKGSGLIKIATSDLSIGGQTVTASGNELSLTTGASAGTIVNSKAVIYGSSGEVNATTLQIAGTSLTATAAQLNHVAGVTSAIQTQLDAKATKGFATAMAIAL